MAFPDASHLMCGIGLIQHRYYCECQGRPRWEWYHKVKSLGRRYIGKTSCLGLLAISCKGKVYRPHIWLEFLTRCPCSDLEINVLASWLNTSTHLEDALLVSPLLLCDARLIRDCNLITSQVILGRFGWPKLSWPCVQKNISCRDAPVHHDVYL